MKFVVDKKVFGEVLKVGTISKTTKPICPIVKLRADENGLYLGAVDPSAIILAGVFVDKDPSFLTIEEEGETFIDVTNINKYVSKLESDNLVVALTEENIIFQGEDETYKSALTDEIIELPTEFRKEGENITVDAPIQEPIKFTVSSLVTPPIKSDNVIIQSDGEYVSIKTSLHTDTYEKKYKLREPTDKKYTLHVDYVYYKTVSELLNKAELIDIQFNNDVLMIVGYMKWGRVAYLLMGKSVE